MLAEKYDDTIEIEDEPVIETSEFRALLQIEAELFDDGEPASNSSTF